MDIIIIIDNISQNYKWCNNYNTIKRLIIYWINDHLIKGNVKSFSVGKTYLEPSLIRLENDELKIENIIIVLDSIVVKRNNIYNCINIKFIFDMIIKNKFAKLFENKKIIIENENPIENPIENLIIYNKRTGNNIIIEESNHTNFKNEINNADIKIKNKTNNKRITNKNISIQENKIYNYTDIYIFASIIELILTEANIKYIQNSLLDEKLLKINFINFSKKQVISIDSKILEKTFYFNINYYELYIEMSQLLNIKAQSNDFTKNDLHINEIFQKLYEIEFENYKKIDLITDVSDKNMSNVYFDYMEKLNNNKQFNFEIASGTHVNFIKHCINWVRMCFIEKNNNININFNIPLPIFSDELTNDYVLEIIKFYKLVYPKIFCHYADKRKNGLVIKKINQLNFSNIKIKKFMNDDSTNYLYSNTTMSNWKEEYENLNPFGIFVKYDLSNFSHIGIYEHDILSTYPNMMISSISNNLISLFDYYQLISADIDISTKLKFSINNYVFIDNLHGNSNIMLPLYINSDHWKLTKIYWTYHMSFINGTFEFDYVKKMDNIYFLILIKTINKICNTKLNQNVLRLLFYILRTNIQICIDNGYSCGNKIDYKKYYNLLLVSSNLEIYKKIFIDYLMRLVQLILTNNIESVEINDNMDTLFIIYVKHKIISENTENYLNTIDKLTTDEKIKEINYLNEQINLNILCYNELKKNMIFLSEFMKQIYSIKKFNQLIKYLDKNNGCLPISNNDLNCDIVNVIICELIIKNNSIIMDTNDVINKTGLIVL